MERVRLRTSGANPDYVEEKIGRELYSQLGGMPRVAAFRLNSVERARTLYLDAVAANSPEPEITGLGLLMLQRSLLACEDLRALLYALADEPHWLRFTSYGAQDLDDTYEAIAKREIDVGHLWLMPPDDAFASEEGVSAEQCGVLIKLRDLTAASYQRDLELVAEFWESHRRSIKNVMHGFSLVPAEYLIEPPGAGVLSTQVDLAEERPFAASLVSELEEDDRTVVTTTYTVSLTEESIGAVRDIAATASALLQRLAEDRRFAVQTGHAFVLSHSMADKLTAAERDLVSELLVEEHDGDSS